MNLIQILDVALESYNHMQAFKNHRLNTCIDLLEHMWYRFCFTFFRGAAWPKHLTHVRKHFMNFSVRFSSDRRLKKKVSFSAGCCFVSCVRINFIHLARSLLYRRGPSTGNRSGVFIITLYPSHFSLSFSHFFFLYKIDLDWPMAC